MKILFADDDQVLLKVVDEFLSKSGYVVELCQTGEEALARLLEDKSPQIALLDWLMPGLSGPEICRKLVDEGIKNDRYLIILSSKTRKQDIAEGLFSGADDYLAKPVDFTELLARIRVAERTMHAHNELKHRSTQLENLMRRNNLLGDMVMRHGPDLFPENVQPIVGNLSDKTAELPGLTTLPYHLTEILKSMGVDTRLVDTAQAIAHGQSLPTPTPPGLLAWAPLLIPGKDLWLDLLMLTTESGGRTLAGHLLGKESSDHTVIGDALAELVSLANGGIRQKMEQAQIENVSPMISRCHFEPEAFPETSPMHHVRAELVIDGEPLLLQLAEYHSPQVTKSLPELLEMDILAQPVLSAGDSKGVLLNQWKPLTSATIASLRRWVQGETAKNQFSVMQPSPLARKLTRYFGH